MNLDFDDDEACEPTAHRRPKPTASRRPKPSGTTRPASNLDLRPKPASNLRAKPVVAIASLRPTPAAATKRPKPVTAATLQRKPAATPRRQLKPVTTTTPLKRRRNEDNDVVDVDVVDSATPPPKRARQQEGPTVKVGHDFCGIQAPLQALENAQIPFEHVFSSDSNTYCMSITKRWFPPNRFYEDVATRDNTKAPYVDLLVFGPPCQPWSSAGLGGGLRDYKDRGGLMFASVGYIEAKRPKCFVMEEVAAVARQDKHKQAFSDLLTRMRSAGYTVTYKVLDTMGHGLPQSRPRLYVVGIRVDIDNGTFKFPSPLAAPVDVSRLLRRKSSSSALHPKDMTKSAKRNYAACVKDAKRLKLDMAKAGQALVAPHPSL
jgi:DNA-cytosine methyltransferase